MSAMLDYMQLCRLCLVKEKVNVPIFGDENDVRQIFLKITACLPVKVAQEDNLPKKICDACLYKVDLLYQFWNTTVNAEKQLIQWLTEIGVDVNIKNSDSQTLPILPQSHAHPHSIPVPVPVVTIPDLKQERPDIVEKPPDFQIPEQPNMYSGYDNLGYPQAEVTMEVGAANTFVQPEPAEEPPPPEPPAPTPKKRGRPAGATNKKSPPKKKPTPAPPVVVSPRTNSTRRSSATAAAAAVAAAAAAATDSEEDSDGDDRLGGMDYDDSDSDEDHITKEEADSDEDYEVKPKSFLGVPSSADGEQPGPSGLGGVKGETSGANATESGSRTEEYIRLLQEADSNFIEVLAPTNRWRRVYKCSTCPKEFNERSQYVSHSMKHFKSKNFICTICNQAFQHKTTMLKHMKLHKGETYKCEICFKEFPVKFNYDKHIRSYPLDEVAPCARCDLKFHSRKAMLVHVVKDHDRTFYCYACGSHFDDGQLLKDHVASQHDGDGTPVAKYQCEICGKRFAKNHVLNAHLRGQHLDMRSVVCDICGKKLSSATSLNEHILLHKGEKPLSCEHCGRTFAKKNTLNVHLRTHTGVRPYACPHCDKRFTQSSAAAIHARKHTGQRPFSCDLCQDKFVTKSCLNLHRKSKHKILSF